MPLRTGQCTGQCQRRLHPEPAAAGSISSASISSCLWHSLRSDGVGHAVGRNRFNSGHIEQQAPTSRTNVHSKTPPPLHIICRGLWGTTGDMMYGLLRATGGGHGGSRVHACMHPQSLCDRGKGPSCRGSIEPNTTSRLERFPYMHGVRAHIAHMHMHRESTIRSAYVVGTRTNLPHNLN